MSNKHFTDDADKHVANLRKVALKSQQEEGLPHWEKVLQLAIAGIAEVATSEEIPNKNWSIDKLKEAGDLIFEVLFQCDRSEIKEFKGRKDHE